MDTCDREEKEVGQTGEKEAVCKEVLAASTGPTRSSGAAIALQHCPKPG